MKIQKYQGQTVTGGEPGEQVEWEGLEWTVTEQGHLVCDVHDANALACLRLVAIGMAQITADDPQPAEEAPADGPAVP